MTPFKLNAIDHVAIRVKDMQKSVNWYTNTLGMKAHKYKEWGEYPIFMIRDKLAVAIFPSNPNVKNSERLSHSIKIDHFAFNVSHEDFKKAQEYFDSIGETFVFQDHHYTHSIYLKDPDKHTVELTTIVVNENEFYNIS